MDAPPVHPGPGGAKRPLAIAVTSPGSCRAARRVICHRRAAVPTSMRKLLLVAALLIGVAGAAPGAATAKQDSNVLAVEGITLCHEGFEIK